MCVLIFSTNFVRKFLILRRIERDMIKNVYWSSYEVPFILVRFLEYLYFLDRCFEKYSNIKFNENPSSGGRSVPCGADGRTDRHMTKLIVAFRNFANATQRN